MRVAKATRYYRTERVGALSDGVFAIVLTLLVLELQLPEATGGENQVWEALWMNSHELFGWLVSFIVLARMWAIHHDTFASLKYVSARTILVNFVSLATVSLVPFAAQLVGTYEFSDPDALIVFSAMLGLTGLTLGWVISCAESDARNHVHADVSWRWRIRHHLIVVPIVSVVAILATLLHPALAAGILVIEAVVAVIVLLSSGYESDIEGETVVGAPNE